ncbi:MAG: amino acid adenylation domain-containing protein, partial [Acidobacteriota bacterium]
GEALDPSRLAPWIERHGDESPRLVNMYGITETTVHVTFRPLTARDARSRHSRIGRPLGDLAAFVLDPHLEPVPAGVPGEIYVAGPGLAAGYLARPELTAERFLEAPFATGCAGDNRLYRTGDLARWVDGELEYLGRVDDQVKLRGYRIELGEIDAAIRGLPEVSAAVTLLHGENPSLHRLVAWVVPAEGAQASESLRAENLRAALKKTLPDYMVPSAFVPVETLPLTPNGKLDGAALPDPQRDSRAEEAGGSAPERALTPQEEALARLWADLLESDRPLAPSDDFFSLGGHSLNATRLASRVRAEMGVELGVRQIFEAPTLEEMAAALAPPAPAPREASEPELSQGPEPLTLSFGQERLWFLDRLASESTRTAYAVPAALRLEGAVEVARLERAFGEIVRRHEPLRTVITSVEGRPEPRLLPAEPVLKIPVIDLQHLEEPEAQKERVRAFERLLAEPFDLASGPLLRVELLRLGSEDSALHVALHHIAADGGSVAVLMRELSHLYSLAPEEASGLPELTRTYAQHAARQRRRLRGARREQLLDFWRQSLDAAPPALDPASDRPRPAKRSLRAGRASFAVTPERMTYLRALGQRAGATPFMTLLAAFALLLSRESGQKDLVIGTPVAGRPDLELEGLVGFFVNTLALRFRIDDSEDGVGAGGFLEHLRRTRRLILDAFEHQELPFEVVVDELKPPRSLAHSPLFQVMLAYQEQNDRLLKLPGLTWSSLPVPVPHTKFDLSFSLAETEEGGLEGELVYARDLWDPPSIEAFLERFSTLLGETVRSPPVRRLADLAIQTPEQTEEMLRLAVNPRPYDLETSLIRRLEAVADRRPDAVAVVADGGARRWSYGELHGRAGRLARLIASRGLGPGAVIGLHLDPSPELLVGLLAVMKAGAAYLPLDPSYPEARLRHMVEAARVDLLLSGGAELGGERRAESWDLGRMLGDPATDPALGSLGPAVDIQPDDPAYLLFTSGSTGLPKGAVIEQRSLANYLAWIEESFLEGAGLRNIPWVTTLAFDTSLKQVFGPWLIGEPVRVVERQRVTDPKSLAAALEAPDSGLSCVPALWELLLENLESGEIAPPAGLRALLLGGEAVSAALVERSVRAVPGLRVWNFYGPTETTATSICGELRPGEPVTLGRPVANNRIYVLDPEGRPTPPLVAGEILIGGVGVSPGYAHDEARTRERFLADPYHSGRAYRTGDAARFLADGRIEFLGRVDRQIKIRGMRLEPSEIEAALEAHPALAGARISLDRSGRLAAHVLPEVDDESLRQARDFLRERLPEHMVPTAWRSL